MVKFVWLLSDGCLSLHLPPHPSLSCLSLCLNSYYGPEEGRICTLMKILFSSSCPSLISFLLSLFPPYPTFLSHPLLPPVLPSHPFSPSVPFPSLSLLPPIPSRNWSHILWAASLLLDPMTYRPLLPCAHHCVRQTSQKCWTVCPTYTPSIPKKTVSDW